MIKTYEQYVVYLKADNLANGRSLRARPRGLSNSSKNDVHKFLRLLRMLEYRINCFNGILNKIYLKFLFFRFNRLSTKLGFFIAPNSIGPGLAINHAGPIVVNDLSKIGMFCRINICVNIGVNESHGSRGGIQGDIPVIGDNVYIGPGVKIFGQVQIANDIAIGANAVVNKSFQQTGITIAGIPARKISDKPSAASVDKRIRAFWEENSKLL